MNRIDLDGQHAVVTGGAQGLDFAMARCFIASVATVTLWDMDAPLLETARDTLGPSASIAVVDVTDWDQVEAARQRTEDMAAPAPPHRSTATTSRCGRR